MTNNRYIPNSLNAKNKPSWAVRQFRKLATRIDPEIFSQEQGGITFDRFGMRKAVGGKFGEFANGEQSTSTSLRQACRFDAGKALANNRGSRPKPSRRSAPAR